MEVIANNITNVSTAGFKSYGTQFQSLVQPHDRGSTTENYSGARPLTKYQFDRDGQVEHTKRNFDAAMLGNGFFITSTTPSSSGDLSMTKAGQFNSAVDPNSPTNLTYLTDIAGNYLLGWPYNTTTDSFDVGTTTASLQAIQIDNNSVFSAVASTTATMDANIPANDAVGTSRSITVPFVDGTGDADNVSDDRAIEVTYTKTADNTWDVTYSVTGGTVATPAGAQQLTFDGAGLNPNFTALSASSQSVTINWTSPAGTTSTIALDMSDMTQFAGEDVGIREISSNGNKDGTLRNASFDNRGFVMGEYTNGLVRPIAKVAAATFANTNGLQPINETHFALTALAGDMTLREPDLTDMVTFVSGGFETSTTQLTQEVSAMIQTQRAYSSAATSLRTVDEMTKTAYQLK